MKKRLRAGGLRCLALLSSLVLALSGCGSTSPPSIQLALDGPPLALRGNSGSRRYVGFMDRGLMTGFGHAVLRQPDSGLVCEGRADQPPTERGRVYVGLACTDGRTLHMLLRSLGPDQGLGLARFEEEKERIDLFFHSCEVEALRRLDVFREGLAAARAGAVANDEDPGQETAFP